MTQAVAAENELVRVAVLEHPRRKPRKDNGEYEIDQLLSTRHLDQKYEPWAYPLPNGYAFTPDFWIPGTRRRDEFHVEVTQLDLALARAERRVEFEQTCGNDPADLKKAQKRYAQMQESWERKLMKVQMTRELYGIETILVTYEIWDQLIRRPRKLDELIGQIGLTLVA